MFLLRSCFPLESWIAIGHIWGFMTCGLVPLIMLLLLSLGICPTLAPVDGLDVLAEILISVLAIVLASGFCGFFESHLRALGAMP